MSSVLRGFRSQLALSASLLLGVFACSSSTQGTAGGTGGEFPFGTGGDFFGSGSGTSSGGYTSAGGYTSSGGSTSAGGYTSSGGASGSTGNGGTSDSGTAGDASVSEGDSGKVGDASTDGAAAPVPVPPPTPVGCLTAADLTPGVHQVNCDTTIDVITVPAQCTKTACGVIVDVHGGMMSSQMEDKNTNLSALGVKNGYIVIQPNALQNPILLNQRLFTADSPGVHADDTRVMDILSQTIQAFHADTKRIHMTGFSEGGYMTWRWYCKHSDLLASIAPGAAAYKCADLANLNITPPEVACQFSGGDAGADVPAHHIPVLYVQGTKDGLVDPVCSDAWLKSNVFPTLGLGAGTQIAGDSTFTRTRYLGTDGVPFEYIRHQYTTTSSFLGVGLVGHCYPGSTDLTITPPAQTMIQPDQAISFGCNDTCSFNWGEEVMKFFIEHPKK